MGPHFCITAILTISMSPKRPLVVGPYAPQPLQVA